MRGSDKDEKRVSLKEQHDGIGIKKRQTEMISLRKQKKEDALYQARMGSARAKTDPNALEECLKNPKDIPRLTRFLEQAEKTEITANWKVLFTDALIKELVGNASTQNIQCLVQITRVTNKTECDFEVAHAIVKEGILAKDDVYFSSPNETEHFYYWQVMYNLSLVNQPCADAILAMRIFSDPKKFNKYIAFLKKKFPNSGGMVNIVLSVLAMLYYSKMETFSFIALTRAHWPFALELLLDSPWVQVRPMAQMEPDQLAIYVTVAQFIMTVFSSFQITDEQKGELLRESTDSKKFFMRVKELMLISDNNSMVKFHLMKTFANIMAINSCKTSHLFRDTYGCVTAITQMAMNRNQWGLQIQAFLWAQNYAIESVESVMELQEKGMLRQVINTTLGDTVQNLPRNVCVEAIKVLLDCCRSCYNNMGHMFSRPFLEQIFSLPQFYNNLAKSMSGNAVTMEILINGTECLYLSHQIAKGKMMQFLEDSDLITNLRKTLNHITGGKNVNMDLIRKAETLQDILNQDEDQEMDLND